MSSYLVHSSVGPEIPYELASSVVLFSVFLELLLSYYSSGLTNITYFELLFIQRNIAKTPANIKHNNPMIKKGLSVLMVHF